MSKNKVFLGGTCNGSAWREELIPQLKIDFFNPVVEDWTKDCIAEENRQKEKECNVHLFVFTKDQTGVYGPVEVLHSHMMGKTVIVMIDVFNMEDEAMRRSFKACCDIWHQYGIKTYSRLYSIADCLNAQS